VNRRHPRTEPIDKPSRLTQQKLADHLCMEELPVRRLVLALRRAVLDAVPTASEAVKFRVLCYFHGDAYFKSIGGNICMIEAKRGRVVLSFIRGSLVEDPDGLLMGKGKFKRFVPIASEAEAASPRVARVIKRAAKIEPWD
jgi:hypothetical protein